MQAFKTIDNFPEAEFEDRKSRFLSFLAPVTTEQDAIEFRHSIMKRVPTARHYVSAYILHTTGLEHYSDAQEPRGTAGLPVLTVLKGHQLEDVVCVVARIFGGTLLGRGGLMRAYTTAAQRAVAHAHIVEQTLCQDLLISIDYPLYEPLAAYLTREDIPILETDFTSEVTLEIRVREEDTDTLCEKIRNLCHGRVEFVWGDLKIQPI